jgi:hypothetical protein
MQVTLSTGQHIRVNAGVQIPVNRRDELPTRFVFYFLWDWFDGWPHAQMDGDMNRDFINRWIAFRHDLHRHPELSFQEKRTAEQIEKALAELGIKSRRVAGTGVVAEIPSGAGGIEGPMVALRADTDALPIHEETGLEYASVNNA